MIATSWLALVPQTPTPTPPQFSLLAMGKGFQSVTIITLVVAFFAVKSVLRLRSADPGRRSEARLAIDTTLFWGAFAFAAGMFATVMGLVNATLSIQAAAPIQPEHHRLIARGVMAAVGSTGYGLFVFMLTGLVWLGLRRWHRQAVPGGGAT